MAIYFYEETTEDFPKNVASLKSMMAHEELGELSLSVTVNVMWY